MALDKQLETDSFTELLSSLVGCLVVWAFVEPSSRFVVLKVMMTMMITGMVFIFLSKNDVLWRFQKALVDRILTTIKRDNYNNAAYNNAAFTNNKRAGGGGGTEYI